VIDDGFGKLPITNLNLPWWAKDDIILRAEGSSVWVDFADFFRKFNGRWTSPCSGITIAKNAGSTDVF